MWIEYIKSRETYTRTVYKPVKWPWTMFAPDSEKVILWEDWVYEEDTSDMTPDMKNWWARQREKEEKENTKKQR